MDKQPGDKQRLRDLILNVSYPVVCTGLDIDWHCAEKPLSSWIQRLDDSDVYPDIEVGPQTHGNSPQFERFRKKELSIGFGNFLDYASSDKASDHWASFSYKSLSDMPGAVSRKTPMNMSFCGFPEISDEITVWLGSRGAHTSCHYDTYGRNVVVQTHGTKRWILFSPDTEGLDPTRVPYEESSVYSGRTFFSPKDPTQNQDLAQHAHVVELGPGMVLIIPPKWWHYVEALENSLSFNAWIPIDKDRVSRVDEYLVLYQLSKIISEDVTEEQRKLLLNPNFVDKDLSASLDLLEGLVKDATEDDGDTAPTKRSRREYTTDYLSHDQLTPILTNERPAFRRVMKDEREFSQIMIQNSSRFCEKSEETLKSTNTDLQLTTVVSLINSLCAPSSIETARKILLKPRRM